MRILGREKFDPIHLFAGDSIHFTFLQTVRYRYLGVTLYSKKEAFFEKTITADEDMIVDEGVVFSDLFEGRRALGAMMVEESK